MSLTVPNLYDKVLSILIEQENNMSGLSALIIGLFSILIAIILTVIIVPNMPVGFWNYMTYDERVWYSIGVGSLTFIWVLVIIVWGILAVNID